MKMKIMPFAFFFIFCLCGTMDFCLTPLTGSIAAAEQIAPQGSEDTAYTYYGFQAGFDSIGIDNAFFGVRAGESNNGNYNTFVGDSAALGHNTGSYNTFVGCNAGIFSTRSYNTFVGYNAGHGSYSTDTTGEYNAFFGYSTGANNTTGYCNTFMGCSAGSQNTRGLYNTFLGYAAGKVSRTGNANTCLGYEAGWKSQSGDKNTMIGYQAGLSTVEGDGNVFLGHKAGSDETASNRLYVHNSESASPLIYGEFDNRFVQINANFKATGTSVTSDQRCKKDIQPLESSLDKISRLRGVNYRWKVAAYPDRGFVKGKQMGLIAQEVEIVLPELVQTDREGYKGISYDKLTAVLVEAVKTLKEQNERQQTQIAELRALIKGLEP